MAQLPNQEAGFQQVTTFKPFVAERVLPSPFNSSFTAS